VKNLDANALASTKPSAIRKFSQIRIKSGTITVIGLNNAFNFSGNSDLPN